MSENLRKIIDLEEQLSFSFDKSNITTDLEVENIVLKISKLLEKINNE